ncbi:fatty acid-binding protein 5 isoform X2 [Callithrix jacchus]
MATVQQLEGRWRLVDSKGFDEYMKELGEAPGLAAPATWRVCGRLSLGPRQRVRIPGQEMLGGLPPTPPIFPTTRPLGAARAAPRGQVARSRERACLLPARGPQDSGDEIACWLRHWIDCKQKWTFVTGH